MISDFIRKGDWFRADVIPGMILQVISTNKPTHESYTLTVSGIKPGIINQKFFSTSGFRISDIPEGQNCGVAVEEK